MLIVARHGESLISSGAISHVFDSRDRLTPRGRLQAKELGLRLASISSEACFHVSPARRACETMGVLRDHVRPLAVEYCRALIEFERIEWLSQTADPGTDGGWVTYARQAQLTGIQLSQHAVDSVCVVIGHAGWASAFASSRIGEPNFLGHGDCRILDGSTCSYWRNPL